LFRSRLANLTQADTLCKDCLTSIRREITARGRRPAESGELALEGLEAALQRREPPRIRRSAGEDGSRQSVDPDAELAEVPVHAVVLHRDDADQPRQHVDGLVEAGVRA